MKCFFQQVVNRLQVGGQPVEALGDALEGVRAHVPHAPLSAPHPRGERKLVSHPGGCEGRSSDWPSLRRYVVRAGIAQKDQERRRGNGQRPLLLALFLGTFARAAVVWVAVVA